MKKDVDYYYIKKKYIKEYGYPLIYFLKFFNKMSIYCSFKNEAKKYMDKQQAEEDINRIYSYDIYFDIYRDYNLTIEKIENPSFIPQK